MTNLYCNGIDIPIGIYILKKFCKLLGSFFEVKGYTLSILETAWNFTKFLHEFSMFYEKLAYIHECSMENLSADSTGETF